MKSSSQQHVRLAHRDDERHSFDDASYRVDGKETKESDTTAAAAACASCRTSASVRESPEAGTMSTSREFGM